MAQNGRVNPDCSYASNPYHECTEACLRKIRDAPPQKNKKSSDYGRTETDGELGKKINDEKPTHSGCSKASNPYHQCDENCYESAIPLKFGWKKKPDSNPEPPVIDSVPASKVRSTYHSERKKPVYQKDLAKDDVEHFANNHTQKNQDEKKASDKVVPHTYADETGKGLAASVEPRTNEHISSEPVSLERHIQDVTPVYQKDLAKDDVEHFANHTQTNQNKKNASDKVVRSTYADDTGEGLTASVMPKINRHISSEPVSLEKHFQDVTQPVYQKDQVKDDIEHFANNHTQTNQGDGKIASDKAVPSTYHDDTGEGLTASAGRLLDFSLSGISITNGKEDTEEETVSVASEARVPVGRYHVRGSYAPILRSIFDKYGDIGASIQLESAVMRTYYIECVCFVVQELQSTPITQFTKSKVKELLAILKDVESAQLQVAWLRSILDEVAEYIELINQHRAIEMAKGNSDSEAESLREELESESTILAQKEQEIAAIKTRIAETRDRLRELELKSSELDESLSLIKSKVDSLDSKSLIDELL